MKKISFFLLILAVWMQTTVVFADAPAKKITPEAKAVLDKVTKAAGLDKMKAAKSLKTKTKMEMQGMGFGGEVESIATQTKSYTKTTMQGQVIETGYNGSVAWIKNSHQGVQEINDENKEGMIKSTLKYTADMSAYFDEISVAGDEKFDDKDCQVLLCKKTNTIEFKFYVDKSTFMIVGTSTDQDTPQGKVNLKMYMKEYEKTKNGFFVVKKMVMDMGMMQMVTTITDIVVDGPIDEKIFDKPAN